METSGRWNCKTNQISTHSVKMASHSSPVGYVGITQLSTFFKHPSRCSSSIPLYSIPLHSTTSTSTPIPPHPTLISSTPFHSHPLHCCHSPLQSFQLHSDPFSSMHSDLATLHSSPITVTPLHSPPLRSGHSPLQSFQLHSIPLSSTPIHSVAAGR